MNHLTPEILTAIESDCAGACIWTLNASIKQITAGLPTATGETAQHARALLAKLQHLAADQVAPAALPPIDGVPRRAAAPVLGLAA